MALQLGLVDSPSLTFTLMSEELPDVKEDLYEHHKILVDAGQELLRIDKFLMDRLPNVTRNKVQNGIREGFVKVNEVTPQRVPSVPMGRTLHQSQFWRLFRVPFYC